MKIAILTMGSRGDVQPYAVLGHALAAARHTVTLATSRNFKALVEGYGINFRPIENDYQQLLDSEEGKKLLKANPLVVKRNLSRFVYPLIRNSLQEFYALALESDLVIYHTKTMADAFADTMPEKMICAMVVPVLQPTAAFPNPAFSGLPIPGFLNKFSYRLTRLSMNMMKKPIRAFREANHLPQKYKAPQTPVLYGISNAFLPRPADYPPDQYFTGFWYPKGQAGLSQGMEQFLRQGEAPVVITFGSMPFKSRMTVAQMARMLTDEFHCRVILLKGWGVKAEDVQLRHPDIYIADSAAYESLFPRVKAVIHHGGIGTTSECLRAGKPMLVCPVLYPIGDQNFWGRQSVRKGVGVPHLPLSRMNIQAFRQRLQSLLLDEQLYANAQKLAARINREDGVQVALRIIREKYELH